ncbi:MAG TPA: hypothetical protein VE991_11415 [Acidimicrobiales bacterium]|nr:hypothetical protein [Acidimicrobiales bacterium]
MADEQSSVAPPGTGAHPTVGADARPEAEIGDPETSADGDERAPRDADDDAARAEGDSAVAQVAATGTALRKGERTSDLDLDEAPGAAGPGMG